MCIYQLELVWPSYTFHMNSCVSHFEEGRILCGDLVARTLEPAYDLHLSLLDDLSFQLPSMSIGLV